MATGHVPAWKKLGLKLKNATNDAGPSRAPEISAPNKRKQPESNDIQRNGASPFRPSKRPRDEPSKPAEIFMGVPVISQTAKRGTLIRFSSPEGSSSPQRKRKSVSFATDTKTTDGEGVKQLYDTWKTDQGPEFDPSTANKALREVEPKAVPSESTNSSKKAKKKKNKKKSKSKSTTIPSDSTIPKIEIPSVKATQKPTVQPSTRTPTALGYLNEYFTSRPTWKFHKANQNYLFKHLFDIDLIPSSYDAALGTYLKGLSGGNMCSRLRREALETRQADEDAPFDEQESKSGVVDDTNVASNDAEREDKQPSLSPDVRKAQYDTALAKLKANISKSDLSDNFEESDLDDNIRRRLLKRKRAEVTIWALGESDPNAVEPLQDRSSNPSSRPFDTPEPIPSHGPIKTNDTLEKRAENKRPTVSTIEKAVPLLTGQTETEQETPRRRVRHRKKRTQVWDEETSSESGSSSDEGGKGSKQNTAKNVGMKYDTSSSGSDSEEEEENETSSYGSDEV